MTSKDLRHLFLKIASLFIIFGSFGCHVVKKVEYPVGIYSVGSSANLQDVANAGFNLVTGPADKDYLDAAEKHGLRVLASPGSVAGKAFDVSKIRKTIARFDRHPALWSWYLIDEPDMKRVAPKRVQEAHKALKNAGANKPTSLVLYKGDESQWYGNIADITMVDRYPVPWLPLSNFSQHIHDARLATDRERPLIAVIQSFDWDTHKSGLPGEENLRPPTEYELRNMTYSALTRGANGIFYYAYDEMLLRERKYPELWAALKRVVKEVRQREALFKAEPVWWPKDHHFENQDTRFNSSLEASVQSVLLHVKSGDKSILPGYYILSVNTTPLFHTYRFRLPWKVTDPVPVTFENRLAITDGFWVAERFEPFAVHIYGPLPLSKSP